MVVSPQVTRETIQMLTTCYPETMGHCIIYLPPRIFSAFFDSVKRLIDPRTASKIVMITGDCSAGSPNDKTMCELIGPEWKVKPRSSLDCEQEGLVIRVQVVVSKWVGL